MTFEQYILKLREAGERATPAPWDAMFVFGSSDLPSEISHDLKQTELIAGVECPKREHICEVHSEATNPTPDFRFISLARNEWQTLISLLERYREALEHCRDFCLCHRNTTGFDYSEVHPNMGKPGVGKRWLTPTDVAEPVLSLTPWKESEK